IPREILFGNPERAQPQLSPDGTKLGYLAPHSGVLNVFVRTVGQNDDRVVTSDKKRGVRGFSWQYDSQHVRYMQDRDGDENFHYYQTNLNTKVTRDLTPFEGARVQGIWGDPKFPDVALVGINARDPKVFDVYRLNLKTGGLEMDTQNPGDVNTWTTDHELQVRVAHVATPDGGMLIRIRDNAKAPWRDFQKWGPEDSFGGVVGFTPDNKGVRLISSVGANTYRLLEMDVASGKTTTIAEDPQYDVGGAIVHPITKKLQAVNFTRARRDWKILDSSIQADFDAIRKIRDGDIGVGGRDLADKTWLVSFLEDDGPVYFYAFERATKKATLLFSHQPALEKYKLAAMKPISFESRDGKVIHGYLTLPPAGGKNLPMVLNVHGGPWGRDAWGFHPEAQWLANRGYA
ncbi:MAG: S9 family peptidase, partial [Gammaproteobacteria bacterium]